jgi:CheY-like chemotaxis protein
MVYGLVKQHDGWIDVSSEPGRGACFSIFLPVHSSAGAEGTPTPSHNDIPRGVETILLAEDEEPVRTLAQRVLEGLGYTVLLARDGQEAVDTFAANQQRVDLLILDGVMPRLSGQKAYQAIQALGRPVPALFITGYSPDRLMVSVDAGKGIWLLHKPFLPSDLARKVREALAGARPAQGQDRSGAGSTGHELA